MSNHAAVQKRQHEESASQNTGPEKSSQAAGVGLPLFMQTNPTASAGVTLQRKCACSGSPGANDECETCNSSKFLQAKLAIGASDDPLEQEADRVADQVLAKPAHSDISTTPPRIQRYTRQKTEGTDTAPDSVDRVLSGSGRLLGPAIRQDMEQRFGHDFSRVRVHTGVAAEQSARDINANAYTVGHDIVFGAARFAPGTHEGRRLLAHELSHVLQQSGSDRTGAGHGTTKVSLESGMVQRQPDTPTIGNIPREARIPAIVVKLVEVNGKWREVRPGTPQRNATGHYDYVLKDGELWAVKRSAGVDQRAVDLYRRPPGHTEAAGGERVTYAGQVKFSNSGQVRWWNEATGHYLSATSLREPVIAAGFSKDKFVASEEVAAGKKGPSPKIGPQLPVFQPKTVPRGEGPVKVPPGPPRVEEFEARYRSSTKGSVFERGSALPKSVIETTGQPPLPKDSVFNIKTADAPAASSATTTGATTTSMKKGRVTVDVDPNAPGYKNMVRVRIDVSDLPPLPKTGGAGGMGPKMVKIALIGETMLGLYGEAAGGETKKNIEKIIDPIKSHFRGKLEDARVEFHSNYRAVSFLKQAAGLEDLRTAYEAAMKRTKIPEAQRAWLGIAIGMSVDNPKVSQEDLQRMVESYNSGQWAPTGAQLDKLEGARQGYEDAAYLVQDQIHQYDQKLMKAHAENIAKRAGILLDAGQSLSDTFWGLMQTVGSIPVVYYQLWSIYDKATLFMELGAGMSAFAGEIRGRAWEYEQAINALEKTLLDVGATRFKGLYREPRK